MMLWAVVALLIRYAPNGRRERGWITIGGVLVIVSWIVASSVFGWWVFHVADYKSPFGTMIAILTLVGYLYTSAIVFLVGAQLDELAIEQVRDGDGGPLDGVL
jgi:membrane protein